MAYHLEKNPKARASFNFVPILLEQLQDYSQQFKDDDIRDPLLALLVHPNLADITNEECKLIVDSCFKAHHEKMLNPFEHYQRLLNIYKEVEHIGFDNELHYLSEQYKADLLTWYHLAWCGESLRKHSKNIQSLMVKGKLFTLEDRLKLFAEIKSTMNGLIPRYQALAKSGQIELTTTPYYHPILPLLIDINSAKDAMPTAPLPENRVYPDGRHRAAYHVTAAQDYHASLFGVPPNGMWPAEGAISHAGLSLMAEHGVNWAASGQGVLANSLKLNNESTENAADYLYQPYKITNGKDDILCFFRDDTLSDKIGFEYASMHANAAISDFVASLEKIAEGNAEQDKVVSVILDGENAWEYYPYNGFYFLKELYEALVDHPFIEMTTFSEIVALLNQEKLPKPKLLPKISAGSWVYGTMSTWIGSEDKNLAWDLLCEAKKVYDEHIQALSQTEQDACERQLAICEGSDWFWWFGDYNTSESVQSFDRLYRLNLINLYELLKQPVPDNLKKPISHGGGSAENAGTMRRGQGA